MYKSPIDIILGEFELKFEDGICKAVREVGIVVDKDELLRALKYDRDQYDKGYKDALATVEVVRCEECYLSGKCVVEDVFNTARMPSSKMFCAAGKPIQMASIHSYAQESSTNLSARCKYSGGTITGHHHCGLQARRRGSSSASRG